MQGTDRTQPFRRKNQTLESAGSKEGGERAVRDAKTNSAVLLFKRRPGYFRMAQVTPDEVRVIELPDPPVTRVQQRSIRRTAVDETA